MVKICKPSPKISYNGQWRGRAQMPSIKDFVEAMGATWPAALAIFLAGIAVLASERFELHYLATLPSWVPAAAFIAVVLSGSVLAVAAVRAVIDLARGPIRRRRQARYYAEHVAMLDDLPAQEAMLLAWAVANSTQVISAPYFNPHIKALAAKGYLQILAGSHRPHETPFRIPSHIWKALKSEAEKDPEALRPLIGQRPFQGRW